MSEIAISKKTSTSLVLQISFLAIPMQIGRSQSKKEVLFKMGFFRYLQAVVRWLERNVYLLVRVVSYARQLGT